MTEQQTKTDDSSARGPGFVMTIAAAVAALALMAWGFQDVLEKQINPNQAPDAIRAADGSREVVLERNRYGHYIVNGQINGKEVTFMLDTGATQVAVPGDTAERIGLEKGADYWVSTANGDARVFSTDVDRLRIGNIEMRGVRASINPQMSEADGDEILLGMSFLKHLELVQRGDHLTLRQY